MANQDAVGDEVAILQQIARARDQSRDNADATAQARNEVLAATQEIQGVRTTVLQAHQDTQRLANEVKQRTALDQQYLTDQKTHMVTQQQTLTKVEDALGKISAPKGKNQVKMPTLRHSFCSAQEFFRFERQVRNVAKLSNWTEQDQIYNVFGNIIGPASDNIKSMSMQRTAYTSMNIFYKQLRLKFVDAAFQTRAREQYSVVIQKHKETLREFHIRLYSLWFDALAQEEEPWCFDDTVAVPTGHDKLNPGQCSKSLISSFLNGIRDPDVKDRIREINDEVGFKTYNDILEKAITRESQVYLRRKDRLITQNRDQLQNMYISAGRANIQKTPQSHHNNRVEPMELGYVSRRNPKKKSGPNSKGKGKNAQKSKPRVYALPPTPKPAQPAAVPTLPRGYSLVPNAQVHAFPQKSSNFRSQSAGSKYCTFHQTNTHNTAQCRAKTQGQSKNSGQWGSSRKPRDKTRDKCHVCQKTGHWAKECPDKRRVHYVSDSELQQWAQQRERKPREN